MLIPGFTMRIRLDVPRGSLTHQDVAAQMRKAVRDILDDAVIIAQNFAPGERLKTQLSVEQYRQTASGASGAVGGPHQLIRFTLPPGTVKHFIPGGLAVSSYGAAAAIQLQKGYAMRFYWERVGAVVYRWSVFHPGYKGSDWGERVFDEVDNIADRRMSEIGDYITARWGSDVEATGRRW